MQFVQIRAFDNYIKANLVLQQLQNAGINAFLQDEYTVTIDPILTNAIGGIKLVVPQPESEKATEILNQIEEAYRQSVTCPVCGSHEVHYVPQPGNPENWLSAITTFLSGSYAIAVKNVYKCFTCNHEFAEMPEE
jgi:DNA-directed RNA polymerase subunit RPC12/RpoP